jgi:hypothetical protein
MTEARKTERFAVRVEPEWVERVKAQARRLGITASAYVTMVVKERLEKEESASKPAGKGKGKP